MKKLEGYKSGSRGTTANVADDANQKDVDNFRPVTTDPTGEGTNFEIDENR